MITERFNQNIGTPIYEIRKPMELILATKTEEVYLIEPDDLRVVREYLHNLREFINLKTRHKDGRKKHMVSADDIIRLHAEAGKVKDWLSIYGTGRE